MCMFRQTTDHLYSLTASNEIFLWNSKVSKKSYLTSINEKN